MLKFQERYCILKKDDFAYTTSEKVSYMCMVSCMLQSCMLTANTARNLAVTAV